MIYLDEGRKAWRKKKKKEKVLIWTLNTMPDLGDRSSPLPVGTGYNWLVQRWAPDQYWVILSPSSAFYTDWKISKLVSCFLYRSQEHVSSGAIRDNILTHELKSRKQQSSVRKKTDEDTRKEQGNVSKAWHPGILAHLHRDHVGKAWPQSDLSLSRMPCDFF